MSRLKALLVLALVQVVTIPAASALPWKFFATEAERAAIKRMPLEERPQRIGHFYGNNVRRMNAILGK